MITNKQELHYYIEIDKIAHGRKTSSPKLLFDYVWKFQLALRHEEYYTNVRQTLMIKYKKIFWKVVKMHLGYKLGFSIPPNCFGPGLRINHYGYLVVSSGAKIGAFCDIHQGVNIGQNIEKDSFPTIGSNVWIGPGVKIFGKVTIADNIQIGANAVVNKSFEESDITIVGIPAYKKNNNGNPFKRCNSLLNPEDR